MLLILHFLLHLHVCRGRSLTCRISTSHNAVIESTVTHHRFHPALRLVGALFHDRVTCKINSIPIHQRIMASNDLSWCRSCSLYRLVFAFHYLHYFAQQFLVLMIDVSFPGEIGFSANLLEVGEFLWARLVDGLLHCRYIIYEILVLLGLDQNAWHIPLVVDSVFLYWEHFCDYFKFEIYFINYNVDYSI